MFMTLEELMKERKEMKEKLVKIKHEVQTKLVDETPVNIPQEELNKIDPRFTSRRCFCRLCMECQ